MYVLTKAETETTIVYDDAHPTATVYTCNTALKRRLSAIADIKIIAQDACSIMFEVPKKWVKIRPPRIMSDEQKAAASERLRGVRHT